MILNIVTAFGHPYETLNLLNSSMLFEKMLSFLTPLVSSGATVITYEQTSTISKVKEIRFFKVTPIEITRLHKPKSHSLLDASS